eukprot:7379801-Pyramimonas_sp.AAC.1
MPPPPSTRATISIPGICPLRLCVFCTGARVHASNRTRLCGRIQGPDWHGVLALQSVRPNVCLAQEQARVRAEMVRKFTQELESREDQVHEIKEALRRLDVRARLVCRWSECACVVFPGRCGVFCVDGVELELRDRVIRKLKNLVIHEHIAKGMKMLKAVPASRLEVSTQKEDHQLRSDEKSNEM